MLTTQTLFITWNGNKTRDNNQNKYKQVLIILQLDEEKYELIL